MSDLVTAIITTYHRDIIMVQRAIESIKTQTYKNIEIIIVDDNQDGNEYSCKLQEVYLMDTSVVYIKQDGNKGACAARNLGIKNAHGKYIAFLDDDDEWLPQKIEKQMNAFLSTKYKNVGIVFCQGYTVIQRGEIKTKELYNPVIIKKYVSHTDMLEADYVGSTSQPLILKQALIENGMFDISLPARQDYDMWIRISKNYEVIGLDEPLFIYNLHEGEQITTSGKKALTGYLTIYNKYLSEYKDNPKAYRSIAEKVMIAAKPVSIITWWKFRFLLKIYNISHKQ